MVELILEIWRRATAVQPTPQPEVVGLLAVLGLVLVLVPACWSWTRLIVTISHEGGHALAAVLTGRRLRAIRLHSDTSGLTISSGRPRGPGMVVMLAAGYLGPALLGLGAALLLVAGRSLGLLWLLVVLLALMLLQVRNFYGFVALLVVGLAMVGVSWYLTATVQSLIAYLITWVLLLAAPKPLIELAAQRRRRPHGRSDPDQLAELTQLPATVWILGFLLANLSGLVVGTCWLLPGVAELVAGFAARLGL
ncbi:M50 family metallopeptidase [Microlunatus panaciterrae]|uniref:Peptidase M50B-like n=1 Tax=Microlunatus panaciterrae TaxID=400768 RepID=A0ABS2RI84_9ACTN|nr:M50 family metallopeptidase [Microlunatus panaciterrae]MBM7798662.1 hypothetical protein [Microlunatus panaciterrae]